jgi:putative ABC transport system permease protein
MNLAPIFSEFPRVLGSLSLILAAALISRWQSLDLEKQIIIAVVRAFIQLTLIGYALDLIFNADNPLYILLIIAVMAAVAVYTTAQRGAAVPNSSLVALIAILFASALTLGILLILDVFDFSPQEIIPIAGMVIGNAMIASSLVMRRMSDEVVAYRLEIETSLALGATARQAVRSQLKRALHSGMLPMIDRTKTVGLIQLPGAMVGMILAGASPLEAVQLQIIVMYMLVGAVAFSGLVAGWLSYRQFFTPQHQLVN